MDELRFYVLSAIFHSYKDDGKVIMKGCVHWNSFTAEKICPSGNRNRNR